MPTFSPYDLSIPITEDDATSLQAVWQLLDDAAADPYTGGPTRAAAAGSGRRYTGRYFVIYWPDLKRHPTVLQRYLNYLMPAIIPRKGRRILPNASIIRPALEAAAGPCWMPNYNAVIPPVSSKSLADAPYLDTFYGCYQPNFSTSSLLYRMPEEYTVLQCPNDTIQAWSRFLAPPDFYPEVRAYDHWVPLLMRMIFIAWSRVRWRQFSAPSPLSSGIGYTSDGLLYINWALFPETVTPDELSHIHADTEDAHAICSYTPEQWYNNVMDSTKPSLRKAVCVRDVEICKEELLRASNNETFNYLLPPYLRYCMEQPSCNVDLFSTSICADYCTFIDPLILFQKRNTWFNGVWYYGSRPRTSFIQAKYDEAFWEEGRSLVHGTLKEQLKQWKALLAERKDSLAGSPKCIPFIFRPADFLTDIIMEGMRQKVNMDETSPFEDPSSTLTTFNPTDVPALNIWFDLKHEETLYAVRHRGELLFMLPRLTFTSNFEYSREYVVWNRIADGFNLTKTLGETTSLQDNYQQPYVKRMQEHVRRRLAYALLQHEIDALDTLDSVSTVFKGNVQEKIRIARLASLLTEDLYVTTHPDVSVMSWLKHSEVNKLQQNLFDELCRIPGIVSIHDLKDNSERCNTGIWFRKALYKLYVHRGRMTKIIKDIVLPDVYQDPRDQAHSDYFPELQVFTPLFMSLAQQVCLGSFGLCTDPSRNFPLLYDFFTRELDPAPLLLAWTRFCIAKNEEWKLKRQTEKESKRTTPTPMRVSKRTWSPADDVFVLTHYTSLQKRMTHEQWYTLDLRLPERTYSSIAARYKRLHTVLKRYVPPSYSTALLPRRCYKHPERAVRAVLVYGAITHPHFASLSQEKQKKMIPFLPIVKLPDTLLSTVVLPDTYQDSLFYSLTAHSDRLHSLLTSLKKVALKTDQSAQSNP